MITYELNTEDVANLIKVHLCEDLKITDESYYTLISSDKDKFLGMIIGFKAGIPVLTEPEYDKIIMNANALDYTPLFIAVTESGIYRYSLNLIDLKFEEYTDSNGVLSFKIADMDPLSGVRMFEWYPDFSSEDEYLDTLMADNLPSDEEDFFLQELIDDEPLS